jgi:N utilization substance protein A
VFVANALSPAQVLGVAIDEEHRIATVTVPERMLSLAIGREGQNARLAARLTGWRIDIRSDTPPVEAPVADAGADLPDPAADASVAPAVEVAEPAAIVVPTAAETAAPAGEAPAVVPAAPVEAPVDAPAAPAKRSRKKAPEEVSS